MTDRVIPLADLRVRSAVPSVPAQLAAPTGRLFDRRGRPLRDLRISVADRCNFRCGSCMPKEVFDKNYRFLQHAHLLSFEEITRLAGLFVRHGVHKRRLTGGEPLLRKNPEVLIGMLSALHTPEGEPLDLTLTTNASLLARKAQALKDAGLQRVIYACSPRAVTTCARCCAAVAAMPRSAPRSDRSGKGARTAIPSCAVRCRRTPGPANAERRCTTSVAETHDET